MRRIVLGFAAAALALSLAPAGATHCPPELVVFFGVDTGAGVRRGLNIGSVGCTADPNDESLNTNYITPGATHAIVGALVSFDTPPDSGSIDIGGVVTDLTFTWVNGRWEGQSVPITGGDVTASIQIGGDTISVVYTELA